MREGRKEGRKEGKNEEENEKRDIYFWYFCIDYCSYLRF